MEERPLAGLSHNDTEPEGQQEAPAQRTSNFDGSPLINNTKPKYRGQVSSHTQKFCQFSLCFEDFKPLMQNQGNQGLEHKQRQIGKDDSYDIHTNWK